MRSIALLTTILVLGALFVGCSSDNNPISIMSSSEDNTRLNRNDLAEMDGRPGGDTITYNILLLDAEYDAVNDQTTFTYEVTSNPDGGPAISHWNIGIDEDCGDASVLAGSNDPLVEWTESDPTTGVRGVKFDTGYDDQEVRTVTITLNGSWSVGEALIAVKAGNGAVYGAVDGPVCGGGGGDDDTTYTISGVVFFDINGDGFQGADEPGIPGVEVILSDGTVVYTDADGGYLFDELLPGDYTVDFTTPDGMTATTPVSVDTVIVDEDVVINAGFELDFASFCGRTADGFTIGFWKNNLRKAIDGRTRGVQVDAETLGAYVDQLSDFAMYPLNVTGFQEAFDYLSANGSDPVLLLSKQLMGSEFNFANGAFIDGNETLTWLFVYYGEYLVANAGDYSAEELLYAKDWFDAYNNSHGGQFFGPDCE